MFSPAVLSIGLPLYNGERWVGHALDAILGQGFQDIEILVTDTGSSDGTEAVVRRYAAADDRVQYLRLDSGDGVFSHHDDVIRRSSGRYFKWASFGDMCLEGFFERAIALMDARPDVILVSTRRLLLEPVDGCWEIEDGHAPQDTQPSVRHQRYFGHARPDNPFHGVIRRRALEGFSFRRPRPAEATPMAELAARGKFVELPEQFFIRRSPASASSGMPGPLTARLADLHRTAARGVIRAIRRYV
jgi:glycosyltransferase involved in cell wall biosynthesis